MATATRPEKKKPVLIRQTLLDQQGPVGWPWLFRAGVASVVFHICLFGLLMFLGSPGQANQPSEEDVKDETNVQAESANKLKDPDPIALVTDVDPSAEGPRLELVYKSERKEKVSVPGLDDLKQDAGIDNAPKENPPISLPLPPGFGRGQGAPVAGFTKEGLNVPGLPGGYRMDAVRLAGTFFGRSGSTKEFLLRDGGGTTESEAAVARGLLWLVRQQQPDGHWALDGDFPNKGTNNDIAGTAFGLLPLLGAGYTHQTPRGHAFTQKIALGLNYLVSRQDPLTGGYGDPRTTNGKGKRQINMYTHGLATIVMCEAYGLTQDPRYGRSAERAIRFMERAQHPAGGWRYTPGQAGDISVFGWQVMALKSAQMGNIPVSEKTLRLAQKFLDAMTTADDGYLYVEGSNTSYSMTSVGLLCRQYLQAWGASNPRMIRGIENYLKTNPPGSVKDIYYYYYATQVMHHYGVREAWKAWNEKMREQLIATQNKKDILNVQGSWAPDEEDRWGKVGGRLMVTSMSLLTLEVYYRHLPLYYQSEQAETRMTSN
jgi:hypothetical protein